MALASSSRLGLKYKQESTFGTTPGTGNHYELRLTGESLNFDIQTETSKEIRSDRQTTDLVQVGASANGGINFELSYGEYDAFIASVLQGAWVEAGTNGESTISATFTTTTLTASTGTPFANVVAGQWIYISGASTQANNGWFKVLTATSSTVLTFAAATFTAEGPTASVKVSGARVSNGTTQTSFTLEKEFGDVTQFLAYTGMTPSKLSLNIASGSMVTGSFDFLGKNGAAAGATVLPGTKTASLTGGVLNGVSHVANILEGGAVMSGVYIKSLSLSADNTLRVQDAIGTLGAVGIGSGTLSLTGNLELYFANSDLYTKFVNNTDSSLSLRIAGSDGKGYVITLPRVKYSSAQIQAGGIGQDVMVSMGYQAIRDTSSGKTIIIDRAGGAVTLPA